MTLSEDHQSISVFTARSSMQRHAQNIHFRDLRASRLWVGPDPACIPFENEDHLKNHAAMERNLRIWPRLLQCPQR
jgi:hypothetical protein